MKTNTIKKLFIPDFILINETIEKFGYNPDELYGTKSHKLIMVCTCFICNNIYEAQYSSCLRRFRDNKKCKFCSNKENSINGSETRSIIMKKKIEDGTYIPPMLGKKHSEEVVRKHIERFKGKTFEELYGDEKAEKLKQELSIRNSGENNPFYGMTHSELSLKKMSIIQKKIARKGKDSNFYGKKYWPKRGKELIYDNIRFRSNWEVLTAKYFDKNNIKWQYEPKVFLLNEEMTYTPDFYLLDSNKWIEVKGYWYDDAIIKYNKFIEIFKNIEIEIWDEAKLKQYNIL
jgi:hypothetical protein